MNHKLQNDIQDDIQDVVIIGGGPTGSTAATLLAQYGYQVTVLEKEKFPRDHVGESLLPFCYNIFEKLGVLDDLRKRFVRKPGVRFVDVDGLHHTTWCFGHVIKDASYLSFHVIRAEFDQLLLNNARKHGVCVKEQMRVKQVDLKQKDGLVRVQSEGIEGDGTVTARFVIDASGRDTFLANQMHSKTPHPDLDRAALSTHWVGAKFAGGIEEGLLQIVYLGGDKKGWIWVIPVKADRVSVGVVLNHDYIRSQKAKLQAAGVTDWQGALYRQELMSSKFIAEILTDAQTAMPLMFNGDYSYAVNSKYGDNFALIGDAGLFIDPIFSSGIFLAMQSANLVVDALHQKFSAPSSLAPQEALAPLAEAYRHINGAYELVARAIRLFYNPDAINFAQAGSASSLIHQQHANAMALGHYLLAGDFFEQYEKYNAFIDLMQNPELFQKYQNFVIDRPAFQSDSCGLPYSQVFGEILAQVQA